MIELLRIDQVMQISGLSRSSIYREMAAGSFPKPIKLSIRAVRWPSDQVDAWVQQVISDNKNPAEAG